MYIKLEHFLIQENIQQAKSILKDLNLDPKKEQDFKEITKSLERLPNLIGKFVEFQYVDKAPKEDVKRVMSWIISNRDSISKLPKNILQYDSLEQLEDDIQHLKKNQKVNKFYKSLYSSMRNEVDKLDTDKRKEFDDLAIAFMDLPEVKQKQFTPLKYFERNRVSINDFIKALNGFLDKNEVNEDKKNILDKIEKYGDKIDVLYNMNNVLVIETEDSKAVCDLGSSSWCIVYGSEGTRTAYFGPETNNTQLLIFNFNLPSSSSYSMFGVTIKPTMEIIQCQDKMNHYTDPQRVMEMTKLPESIFKPNETKAAMYMVENTIKTFVDNIKKLSSNNPLTLQEIIKKLLEKLKELEDQSKVKDNLDEIVMGTMKRIFNSENLSQIFVLNTFSGKTPQEMYGLMEENKYMGLVINKAINYRGIVNISFNLHSIESCHFLVQYYLENNKDQLDKIDNEWVKWHLDRSRVNDYHMIWNMTDLKGLDDEKYPITISSEVKNAFIDLFHQIRNDITMVIIDHPREAKTFTDYKNVYDSSNLEEEYPYQYFLDDGLYEDTSTKFIGDELYRDFLVKLINDTKDNDLVSEDCLLIISNICQNAHTDYSYDILDDHDSEIVDMIEKTDSEIPTSDHILGLMMYKNTKKYNQKFREQMKIKTDENGQDYVVVSDFTSFDDLIFKEDYFNNLDDYDTYYEKYSDSEMRGYMDELDNYNLIDISQMIESECSEVKLLTDSIKEKYFLEGKLSKGFMDKYDKDEDLKKLERELTELLFDTDEDDLDEINPDLSNFIDENIKRELLNRAMNDAYNSSYRDEVWRKLIDAVSDALGGGYWPETDDDRKYRRKSSIYKFMKTDPEKTSELVFTIDLPYIVDSIESYSDLHYNTGTDFDWEGLVTYVRKVLENPTKLSFDYIYGSIDKENLNDAIRNL